MAVAVIDSRLEQLLLEMVGKSEDAANGAIDAGLLTMDSLDPSNQAHVDVVKRRVEELGEDAPDKFLSKLDVTTIVCLAEKNPKLVARVTRLLQADSENATAVVSTWIRSKSKAAFPVEWLPFLKNHILIDGLAAWETVRHYLPTGTADKWEAERDSVRDKADKAAKEVAKKERAARPPKIDPLIDALNKRDTARLRNIQLETLKPARWEKAKTIWRTCSREIRARMARLPWNLVKDDAKDVLECLFGKDGTADVTLAWPVPKELFKSLALPVQARVLRSLIVDRTPNIEPQLDMSEVTQLLIGVVLADPDMCRLADWFQWVGKIRQIKKLANERGGVALTPTEDKILRVVADVHTYDHLETWLNGDEECDDTDVSYAQILSVVDWCLGQPIARQRAVARRLVRLQGFRTLVEEFAAGELRNPRFSPR